MTTITMQLSDDIVNQAKQAGVYDEGTLVDKIHQFLQMQTKKSRQTKSIPSNIERLAMPLEDLAMIDDDFTFTRIKEFPKEIEL